MSVHKKLMEARIRLQNTKLTKSGLNKFAGYQYFELGDFLPATQIIFSELGLCGTVSFGKDMASLTITEIETDKEVVIYSPMADAVLKGCHPIQNLGAAQTYLRRYLWVTAMEIVEHDALDATTGQEGKGKGVHKPTDNTAFTPDEEEVKYLSGIIAEIISAENDPAAASAKFYGSGLDNDEQVYIWNALGKYSALRRAMKEHNAALLKKEG